MYKLEEIGKKIKPIVEKYNVPKVWIFGSYARGEADESSDIDLAINYEESNAKGLRFISLERELSELLGIEVQLLTEHEALSKRKYSTFPLEFMKDRKVIYERK